MKSFFLLISFGVWTSHILSQYHIYDSPYNQIVQTIIQTKDGGFLIASNESCYTPEEWMIEGCPIGIQLIKTNSTGDILWTNEIVNHDILGLIYIFENEDGTFTIISSQDGNFMCHEWTIGPDFGLPKTIVYHVSDEGDLLHETTFPDECQLDLISVEKIADTTFVVLTKYSEPFASDTVEARLFIMNHRGVISNMKIFPGDPYLKGDLMIDSNRILVFHMDINTDAILNIYDSNLNVLQSFTNNGLDSTCLATEDTRASAALLENGNIFVMCDNPFNKGKNVELFTFNESLILLSNKQYTIPLAANFTESDEGEIVIASEYRVMKDSTDIKLSYFSFAGDSLDSRIIYQAGNQTPYHIMWLQDDHFAVTGTHNCCNLHASIGPGLTFLYLAEEITSVDETQYSENTIRVFPNPVMDLIEINFDDELKNKGHQAELFIYSVTGILMESLKITGEDVISLSRVEPGIYFLLFEIDSRLIQRNRIVKM